MRRREEKGPLIFAGVCLATGLLSLLLAGSLVASEGAFSLFDFLSNLCSQTQDEPVDTILSVDLFLLLALIGIGVYVYVAVQRLFVIAFVRERRGFRATFPVVALQALHQNPRLT